MLGKGRMYKDASAPVISPAPEPDHILSDLLFNDYDLEEPFEPTPESNIAAQMPAADSSAQTSTEINTLKQVAQTIVKQRNVSKIIIMFDDGTFQEM
jgi:hypothetical protein